ncbi:MAG: hypothetical protein IKP20_07350 [Candidatus Methanomethylophilaceae archaeon]|nr:hypothetical protein [Candidatus Methanomethylophilaceae archaeon]
MTVENPSAQNFYDKTKALQKYSTYYMKASIKTPADAPQDLYGLTLAEYIKSVGGKTTEPQVSGMGKPAITEDMIAAYVAAMAEYNHYIFWYEPIMYTVTILTQGESGTVDVNKFVVPYGTTLTTNGNELSASYDSLVSVATPDAPTAQFTYFFAGWTDVPAKVVEDCTVYANFAPEINEYTVTVIAQPEGYGSVSVGVFNGVPYGTALSTADNVFTVADMGDSVATPAPADAQYTYFFVNWTNVPAMVTGDTTVIANFDRSVNGYTVTVIAQPEGYGTVSVAKFEAVPYGTTLSSADNVFTVAGKGNSVATPTPADAQYTYSFIDWTIPTTTVTSDVTVIANFQRVVNEYTVTVIAQPAGYGTVSVDKFENVPYGTALTAAGQTFTVAGKGNSVATPAPADDQYTYYFVDWTIPTTTVTSDVTVIANFDREVNRYVVNVIAQPAGYGTVSVSVIPVDYGDKISAAGNVLTVDGTQSIATPTPADAQYTYKFVGWDIPEYSVTGNSTVIANFERVVNQYTVTVVAQPVGWGTVDKTFYTVDYGTQLTTADNVLTVGAYGITTATPAVSTLGDYTYSFAGWDNAPAVVTEDWTVIANFDRTALKYAVNVIFTCEGQEIVPGVSSAQDYGATYTYNYMNYPGYPSKGVPAAPAAFEGYVLTSAEEYTITVQANPTGSKIVNTIEFTFDHVKKHVMLWLQGDPGYNLSFDVNYGDDFNQVIQAYGDNVGKKMGIAFEEYGTYSYAPATTTHDGSTLTLNVIDSENTEVVFGPITEDVILYYNYL